MYVTPVKFSNQPLPPPGKPLIFRTPVTLKIIVRFPFSLHVVGVSYFSNGNGSAKQESLTYRKPGRAMIEIDILTDSNVFSAALKNAN